MCRLEILFRNDPFSRDSLQRLDQLETAIQQIAAKTPGTNVLISGPTASVRDLKLVTDNDRVVVSSLVVLVVYLVLVLLLRATGLSLYLVMSVCFSYIVTIGATYVTVRALSTGDFPGLDWNIPMFQFTILVAIGEDYNIFLMTRVREEQKRHGAIKGIQVALHETGKIISSCGLIMAGTFAALMSGTLAGMQQMGFALAFGLMLDTFVVRTILVPAWLVLTDGRHSSNQDSAYNLKITGGKTEPRRLLQLPWLSCLNDVIDQAAALFDVA